MSPSLARPVVACRAHARTCCGGASSGGSVTYARLPIATETMSHPPAAVRVPDRYGFDRDKFAQLLWRSAEVRALVPG
ncbi:MAG TPA: hypothetical protein PKK06_15070 [Phycisphaerae bacterium]|nr:hypothetical protein [Phycisphaerae bacterium]